MTLLDDYKNWSKSFNRRRNRGAFSGTSSPRRRRSRRRSSTGFISPI